ncbi:MAG: phage baseplate protein [Roseiflexaceae bacterium]
MRSLSASELLQVWDHGLAQSPVQRAIALLTAACDDTPLDALTQLSIGQRDARLLTLREWAFGSHIDGIVVCPGCGERLEMAFDISEIRAAPRLPDSGTIPTVEAFEFGLGEYALCFRLPNSRDLSAIAGSTDLATSRRLLFERCVLSAQRDDANISTAELPDEVVAAATAGMAQADPQADVQIALTCPACVQPWQATFDILAFFWQEMNDWAQRILREVHTLASAYGWREADILALTPRRRQFYLDLVG